MRVFVGFQSERTDLPFSMAFLTVFLKDLGDILRISWGGCRLVDFRERAADGLHERHGYLLAAKKSEDSVLKFVAFRVGVGLATVGELVVDPAVVADLAGRVDHEGFRRDRGPNLPRELALAVLHHRELETEILRVTDDVGSG